MLLSMGVSEVLYMVHMLAISEEYTASVLASNLACLNDQIAFVPRAC
jgi:hypothetical protein